MKDPLKLYVVRFIDGGIESRRRNFWNLSYEPRIPRYQISNNLFIMRIARLTGIITSRRKISHRCDWSHQGSQAKCIAASDSLGSNKVQQTALVAHCFSRVPILTLYFACSYLYPIACNSDMKPQFFSKFGEGLHKDKILSNWVYMYRRTVCDKKFQRLQ